MIRVNNGETFSFGGRESDVSKKTQEAMLVLANAVMVKRLSNANKPAHLLESERQSLQHRRLKLKGAAAAEFAKILRNLGSNLNDLEIATLFDFFNLETNTLHYLEFASSAKSILTPRRKAIERVFKKLDSAGEGALHSQVLNLLALPVQKGKH